MNKHGIVAAALTVGSLALAAPVLGAPAAPGGAHHTIASLEDEGYRVVVERLSERPLAVADVIAVRRGTDFPRVVHRRSDDRRGTRITPGTTTTVYVTVR